MKLYVGDCREIMKDFPDNSIDAIVTDPPYELGFMGKGWDKTGIANDVTVWRECLRVLKPGGHLLSFGGTRTYHRMACAVEDAGFEVRDQIMWIYGSGFPKSADVSKQIDQQEKNRWLKIIKAIDNANVSELTELWINSKSANAAGLKFQRKATEAGRNTEKNDSAQESVLLQVNQESSDALAVIAELSFIEAHPTSAVNCTSAQSNAESAITESKGHVKTAGSSPENRAATRFMVDFSALESAWGWQGENTADKLKAVEALKTWLGEKPSSRTEATSALCAELTDDLKHIILSQSKTFLSYDTIRQLECASAITVTITEYTAENLISFMANTLRSKAIDKAAGAERQVVGVRRHPTLRDPNKIERTNTQNHGGNETRDEWEITEAATEDAKQWQGWGTALKPAHEPIVLARKPLKAKTVAANVLEFGTGAINVDGCRVGTEPPAPRNAPKKIIRGGRFHAAAEAETEMNHYNPTQGRWPANLIHDGSAEVVELFPVTASGAMKRQVEAYEGDGVTGFLRGRSGPKNQHGDSGSAARFFYCAKASKKDRDEGLEDFEEQRTGAMQATADGSMLTGSGNERTTKRRNIHPTVKPTDLMRYLCRLITPPGGVVLDPFMGSGSTGKAAILEGFDFIGIELSSEYVEIAEARIGQ